MKQIQKEIKNVQGPLANRAVYVLEHKLGLVGSIWYDDFIGPDVTAFLKVATVPEGKTKFKLLLDFVMEDAARTTVHSNWSDSRPNVT